MCTYLLLTPGPRLGWVVSPFGKSKDFPSDGCCVNGKSLRYFSRIVLCPTYIKTVIHLPSTLLSLPSFVPGLSFDTYT